MTAQVPPDGQWVRVVLEGVVDRCSPAGDSFDVGGQHVEPGRACVKSVEIVDPPEPDWQAGATVMDCHGAIWLRTVSGWLAPGNSVRFGNEAPARPLTRLVPEER